MGEGCEGSVGEGCGTENMSLNTEDARDRMSLWAWNSLTPDARRMTSASGGSFHSAATVKVADKKWEQEGWMTSALGRVRHNGVMMEVTDKEQEEQSAAFS